MYTLSSFLVWCSGFMYTVAYSDVPWRDVCYISFPLRKRLVDTTLMALEHLLNQIVVETLLSSGLKASFIHQVWSVSTLDGVATWHLLG